jgi:hypothetical protein
MTVFPGNNTGVDTDRKFMEVWLRYFEKLLPSTSLSSDDVATLKTFIAAATEILADPEPFPEFPEFTPYAVDYQSFSTSGTWTKPNFGTMALIRIWGPGGSGGSGAGAFSGSGGGGGVFIERFVPLSQLGDTETVTLGTPGAAVTGNNAGIAGTDSSFGAVIIAPGGGGGLTGGGGIGGVPGGYGAGYTTGASGFLVSPGSTSLVDALHPDTGAPGGGTGRAGGRAFRGGGGGASSGGTSGASELGGDGGAPNTAGSVPGGGGGGTSGGTSGAGGAAYCEVYVF